MKQAALNNKFWTDLGPGPFAIGTPDQVMITTELHINMSKIIGSEFTMGTGEYDRLHVFYGPENVWAKTIDDPKATITIFTLDELVPPAPEENLVPYIRDPFYVFKGGALPGLVAPSTGKSNNYFLNANGDWSVAAIEGPIGPAGPAGPDGPAGAAGPAGANMPRIYASTTNALSNGVISTTGLVGGSGGANGTFSLAFSGGGGTGAAGRFVVSGGAVTSVVLTSPGVNYTSAPTISFSASTGLTGASVTTVIGQNEPAGNFFGVADGADPNIAYKVYENVSGTATLRGTVAASLTNAVNKNTLDYLNRVTLDGGAISSAAIPFLDNLANAKRELYSNTLLSLHGHSGLKKSGTNVTKMYSFDPNAHDTLELTTIYNGNAGGNVKPTQTNDGVFFDSETGFNLNTQEIMPAFGSSSFLWIMSIKFPGIVAYANTTAMNADLTNQPNGTIAKVSSGVWTTNTVDIQDPRDAGIRADHLVDGYYLKRNTATEQWVTGLSPTINSNLVSLFNVATPNGSWTLYLEKHGRLFFQISQALPSVKQKNMRTFGMDCVAAGTVTLALYRGERYLRLFANGEEVYSVKDDFMEHTNTSTSVTSTYINGTRISNANNPVNGMKFTLKSLEVMNNVPFLKFKEIHDVIARAAGTDTFANKPKVLSGFIHSGQSWTGGATGAVTSWTTPTGWNGEVSSYSAETVIQSDILITRSRARGTYSTYVNSSNDFFNDETDIGALSYEILGNGNITGPNHGPYIEDAQNSAMFWLSDISPNIDWAAIKRAHGGTDLNTILTNESTPQWNRLSLKKAPGGYKGIPNLITDYEHILKIVANMRDWAIFERGYNSFEVSLFFWQHGQSGVTSGVYETVFLADYDKLNADIKKITGQNRDVICLIEQIVGNSTSATSIGTKNNDISKLAIIDQRGLRPIYLIGPMYPYTSFLHPPRHAHRGIGEQVGKIAKKVLDGEVWEPVRPKTFTLGSNYVDIQFYVPVPPLQFTTNSNNIDAIVQTSAINTYGFGYSGGGLTITSVTLPSADTVRINLSGTPVAGHIVRYIIDTCRYGNLCDSDATVAKFRDQDWTLPIVSGRPRLKDGLLNDLRNWGCAFTKTL